jgi:hypothetical protein
MSWGLPSPSLISREYLLGEGDFLILRAEVVLLLADFPQALLDLQLDVLEVQLLTGGVHLFGGEDEGGDDGVADVYAVFGP